MPISGVELAAKLSAMDNAAPGSAPAAETVADSQADDIATWTWRKYGQKRLENDAVLKLSYKCSVPGCMARKVVTRNTVEQGPVRVILYSRHTHLAPVAD